MGQALKSPLRIPALDHGIAESVDDLVVGTDDSRIAAKSLDQCWLVVDAKLAVEPSLHRFSRSQLPKGFKALSISHVLEVCSLQAPGARSPGGQRIQLHQAEALHQLDLSGINLAPQLITVLIARRSTRICFAFFSFWPFASFACSAIVTADAGDLIQKSQVSPGLCCHPNQPGAQ